VKREDAAGVGFGGNKLRKLDYVLHEAMAGNKNQGGLHDSA
jgi:L-cysteate sulfo-lyase